MEGFEIVDLSRDTRICPVVGSGPVSQPFWIKGPLNRADVSPTLFTSHPSGANPTADSTIRTPLVTRKAEAHEPLAVERPRHLLQDRDATGVDLDQVVVGEEDRSDFALCFE